MAQPPKFIPGEEIGAISRWKFSDVEAAALLLEEQERERELNERIEQARQQAHTAGYSDGYQQGRAQTLLEAQKQIAEFIENQGRQSGEQFGALLASTGVQLEQAEQMAAQGVLELACELARQVLRHEIASNPNVLLPVIREALGQLFSDARAVQVRLNPVDLDVLQEVLQQEYPNMPLKLQPDPAITRGGCVVESAGTVVDGRLETRWARAVARLGQSSAWDEVSDEPA
jgi:flagellar assembly protein FliH